MAALDTLRDVTTELLVRATRGISAGSLLNADSGRADTSARLDDWAGVLSLYPADNESPSARATA
ncbi:hypothetical protein [Kribbella solani]|uniref:Uncharacterized protein n=1 Tax=Kribbella solani TaxID=236067 RepID=A0A841DLZ4_9ACTN|nr:hypothetical protein [Kribbella solani]MBB5979562.1 hypothetical protein [Kribbella solani]MDX2968671.1 hypothetical protein [Kribbella solani]MDX3006673.1 hypothetical protein [Kribbella solani]